MSVLWEAEIVNVVVLAAVLLSDLGPHRKIGTMRLLRPVIAAAVIVPLFVRSAAGSGHGLLVEVGGAVAGILVAALALSQVRVYRGDATGRAVSRAGLGYALVWIVVIGARAVFSYGSYHLFQDQLVRWLIDNRVSGDALTDALVFMAITMLLARTLGLAARARRVNRRQPPTASPSATPEGTLSVA